MNKIFIGITLLIISGVTSAAGLEAKNPWIREAPPTAKNLAGYVELANTGDSPVEVIGATSTDFEKVEIHITTFENGMMRMKEISSLKLQPQEVIEFEPGGRHFMLIKPKKPIKAELEIPVKLKLRNGEETTVLFKVRK